MTSPMDSPHLTDEEAVRAADAQPVSQLALSHLGECDACAERVAEYALASHAVQLELRALAMTPVQAPSSAAVPVRSAGASSRVGGGVQAPSPIRPLIVGAFVALAASIPLMPSTMKTVAALSAGGKTHGEALSCTFRSLVAALDNPAWSFVSTAMLVLAAALAAVVATRASKAVSPYPEGVNR